MLAKKDLNEGLNTQKNGGFDMEHVYSTQDRQVEDYYLAPLASGPLPFVRAGLNAPIVLPHKDARISATVPT